MILHGNSLEVLKTLEDNSVDSVCTDPPYGLKFMGKKWDYDVPSVELWREVLRVLKPGGHLLSFGGTRTYHRMVVAIEDAGFEIRDQIMWIYGSGFPKSHNLKDKWQGFGTALKPANEPIVLARKPLEKGLTIAENVLKYGTGALNIDGSRIEAQSEKDLAMIRSERPSKTSNANEHSIHKGGLEGLDRSDRSHVTGRWPANVILGEVTGCAEWSRFFYVAKASKRERNEGLDSHEIVSVEHDLCKDALTAAVQLLQRVTSEDTAQSKKDWSWSTGESGKSISVIFPKECKFTIKTESKTIIESKTWSLLIHLLTSESIRDVSAISSLAENAENLKAFLLNITKGKTELALGAVNAAFKTLQRISESEEPKSLSNFHSTVKPIKLMRYLTKLITPPGGTVIDPFMGSGSTGVAAIKEGFQFIGIELNEEYVEIAKRRVEKAG